MPDPSLPPARRSAAPAAVLAHGAASSPDFVERALGAPLQASGWTTHVVAERSGSVIEVVKALDGAIHATGARLVAGISLGAHAAARWAATERHEASTVDGLLLVLPAWTGPPGAVAGLSAAAAEEVERLGLTQAISAVEDGSWVGEELAKAWPAYGSGLADVLRATSRSPGPTLEELGRIDVPVGLVAFVGDPFHPLEVARAWCAALPRAVLVELPQAAPAVDRAVLGRAALSAFRSAQRDA